MDSSVHRGEPVPIPAVEVYLDRQVTCLVDGVDGVDGVDTITRREPEAVHDQCAAVRRLRSISRSLAPLLRKRRSEELLAEPMSP